MAKPFPKFYLDWSTDGGKCHLVANFSLTIRLPWLDHPNLAGAWIAILIGG